MCEFTFVVADDNGSDGTQELLTSMKEEIDIHILNGGSNLYCISRVSFKIEEKCFGFNLVC